jgi:hypothetical protein
MQTAAINEPFPYRAQEAANVAAVASSTAAASASSSH